MVSDLTLYNKTTSLYRLLTFTNNHTVGETKATYLLCTVPQSVKIIKPMFE